MEKTLHIYQQPIILNFPPNKESLIRYFVVAKYRFSIFFFSCATKNTITSCAYIYIKHTMLNKFPCSHNLYLRKPYLEKKKITIIRPRREIELESVLLLIYTINVSDAFHSTDALQRIATKLFCITLLILTDNVVNE